jgi:hypothetical protein
VGASGRTGAAIGFCQRDRGFCNAGLRDWGLSHSGLRDRGFRARERCAGSAEAPDVPPFSRDDLDARVAAVGDVDQGTVSCQADWELEAEGPVAYGREMGKELSVTSTSLLRQADRKLQRPSPKAGGDGRGGVCGKKSKRAVRTARPVKN